MAEWTPDLLKQHYDERLTDLWHRLDGFPQEYATKELVEKLDGAIDLIIRDHVQRREFDDAKAGIFRAATQEDVKQLREDQQEGRGRRAAFAILGGIVATVMVVLLGFALRGGLTHADVSQQIQAEAPWVQDRPAVERRLAGLERENEALKARLAAVEALDRFFCKTRQPTLPAC